MPEDVGSAKPGKKSAFGVVNVTRETFTKLKRRCGETWGEICRSGNQIAFTSCVVDNVSKWRHESDPSYHLNAASV